MKRFVSTTKPSEDQSNRVSIVFRDFIDHYKKWSGIMDSDEVMLTALSKLMMACIAHVVMGLADREERIHAFEEIADEINLQLKLFARESQELNKDYDRYVREEVDKDPKKDQGEQIPP